MLKDRHTFTGLDHPWTEAKGSAPVVRHDALEPAWERAPGPATITENTHVQTRLSVGVGDVVNQGGQDVMVWP